MPREHVYAQPVTVTAGDLPVLAARTRADLDAPSDHLVAYASSHAPDAAVRVQLRVTLAWSRGGRLVTLGVTAHDRDADRGAELDLGGYHVELDWAALNRLVALARDARDESFGRPE